MVSRTILASEIEGSRPRGQDLEQRNRVVARLGEVCLDLEAQRELALVTDHDREAVELVVRRGQ